MALLIICVIYLASPLINAGEIDFRHELYGGRRIRVAFSTMDIQAVDPIFMRALRLDQQVHCFKTQSACHT